MNKNTAGAVLMLIVAAAGLHRNVPEAWVFAAMTCVLVFVTEELRDVGNLYGRADLGAFAAITAVGSWVSAAIAFTSLLF
jgi:hypothetical protein